LAHFFSRVKSPGTESFRRAVGISGIAARRYSIVLRRPILTTRFAWIVAAIVGVVGLASLDHHGARAATVAITSDAQIDAARERADEIRDAAREQADAIKEAAQDRIDAANASVDTAREAEYAMREAQREQSEAIREAQRAQADALREERRALREAQRGEHIRISIPGTVDIETNS